MQRRLFPWLIALPLLLVAMSLPAAGPGRAQRAKLAQTQAAYVAAVRWSDFDAAENFIDPQQRQAHPLGDVQRERYRQVQVSSYRERSSSMDAEGMLERRIEMGVINRNTQAERTVLVTERWRWDPQAQRWWPMQGPPDLWQAP